MSSAYSDEEQNALRSGDTTPRRALSFPKLSFDRLAQFDEEEDASESEHPAKQRGTPSLAETSEELRRTLSFKTLKEADSASIRKRLWRPSPADNKDRRRPQDLDQLIAFAIRGGCRAFILAFTARSGFNGILLFLSVLRRKYPGHLRKALMHALFGATPLRFGLLFSAFAACWRFCYHGLRIWNPGHRGPGKEERWHAAAAGAVASLALLAERPSNRSAVSQQVFVRALQGIYHRLAKEGLHIPHGDVLLFSLCSGQIMYSWIAAPRLLEKGYRDWIVNASRLPNPIPEWQGQRARRLPFDLSRAPDFFKYYKGVLPQSAAIMNNAIKQAKKGDYGPPVAPCAFNHPHTLSCQYHALTNWFSTFTWILPVYTGLTFVPPLLFRTPAVKKQPLSYLNRATTGTIASSAFVATYVFLFQSQICTQRNVWLALQSLKLKKIADLSTHRFWLWIFGFFTGASLFVENKKRREELAIYVLPKAMTALWRGLQIKGKFTIAHGEVLLNIIGVALLTDSWRHHREALSSLVRTILWQALGQ